ncbi:tellurite resistance protein TerB [bacterium BMS3Abin04]|nr:tellurite resistance protein TerB [bacterium BMS3Abin04]
MLNYFKEMFHNSNSTHEDHSHVDKNKIIQIATCALFLEVADADDNYDPREKEKIILIMEETFNLSRSEVDELLKISNESVENSVSIYEFTEVINKNFSYEEKYNIMLNLWRLVFVDHYLHKYEEYTLRKISSNLSLEHKDFIAAKLQVKEELKSEE